MIIYPAIDLKNNKCVRLYQGNFDQETVYSEDPLEIITQFKRDGATWVHIIDLNAAKNPEITQFPLIKKMAIKSNLKIQTGGGIRTKDQIEKFLDAGIKRVIIGSLSVHHPKLVKEWIHYFGNEYIVLAFDTKQIDGQFYVATKGWQHLSNIELFDLIDDYICNGLKHVLCTDIDRDGTLAGPNIDLYLKIMERFPNICLQASGGVSNLQDLKNICAAKIIDGVITGKALYEKKFTLKEALSIC